MIKDKHNDKGMRYWYEWLPWLFILIALPVTYVIWHGEREAELNAKKHEFETQLNETSNQLSRQLALFDQSLHAIRSFFEASEFVSGEEFDDFVAGIAHSKYSSGVYQLGFIKLIDPNQPETFRFIDPSVKQLLLQQDDLVDQLRASVVYVMPKPGMTSEDEFYDVFSINQLKKDLEYTALHNTTLISEPIKVAATQQGIGCDCLSMILPIYKHIEKSTEVLKGKASHNNYGWVFLNIDLNVFFQSVLGNKLNPVIRYSLYQKLTQNQSRLLYENSSVAIKDQGVTPNFTSDETINMHGQMWTLSAQSLPAFDHQSIYQHSNRVGILGLLISFAISGLLFFVFARMRALDELKRMNKQLEFSDNLWQFALEGAGDGVWDWDIQNNKVVFSKKWKQMLGFDDDEPIDDIEQWQSRVHPDEYTNVKQALNATLNGRKSNYSVECRVQCRNGTWKWMLTRGMVISRSEAGEPLRMVGTQTDISGLKESEEIIWQHANFDSLTGLPNRRMLYARLEQEIQKCNRTGLKLGLLFLDLDRFKEVNDLLGHDQGDVLLSKAAIRLRNCTYVQDIVARLGGDEFMILVSDIEASNLSNLEKIAQKVLKSLAEPFTLGHEEVFVTASIGIAIYPDDSMDVDDLVKSVDQAMYASKKRGGNCFTYFTQEMQQEAINRMQLSNDLRTALSKNQLFIEYQPIVELRSGKIHKAEALLRWQHPQRGLVPPAVFIPIAEDNRIIYEIGNWVFTEAIKQSMDWRKRLDPEFQVAVNKSPLQFLHTKEEGNHWAEALLNKESGVDSPIVIEITENLLLEASAQVLDCLAYYKKNGIQVSLDDFGTGYSSLSYLRKFEIDYLKIDRSFVASLEESHGDVVLCEAIIAMAHSLGIKVVAEGIETARQRDILLDKGCDYGQGYYFSKSISASDFEVFVKNNIQKSN
jgi:diguanylate cyclase (GGDEF)-like protein/PAS domain S-box-containing protein